MGFSFGGPIRYCAAQAIHQRPDNHPQPDLQGQFPFYQKMQLCQGSRTAASDSVADSTFDMIPYEELISGPVCNFFKADGQTARADGRFMKACHFEARLRRPLLGFQLRRADLILRRASNSTTAGLARPMAVLQRRVLISLVYRSQWPLYQSQWPFYQGLQFLSKVAAAPGKAAP